MCRFLQVLHPFRDLVWLRREGPPPGPAIRPKWMDPSEDLKVKKKGLRVQKVGWRRQVLDFTKW